MINIQWNFTSLNTVAAIFFGSYLMGQVTRGVDTREEKKILLKEKWHFDQIIIKGN